MSYHALDSIEVVQVYSPSLVSDALLVTIMSAPSGSVLIRTVPKDIFDQVGQTSPILASLSDAVENILQGGLAVAAQGVQGIDDANLIFDAVDFTVAYVPSTPLPGRLTVTVQVPVDSLTADTQFGSFLTGGSAVDQIQAAYDRLAAMATG